MAVGQLPAKLTQNTLDFWAKQIQEFVDAYYGSDTDNNSEPIYLPFTIDCYTPYTTQSLFSGGNGYLHGFVHFVIPVGNTDNFIKGVYPSEPWASAQDQTIINQYAQTYLNKNDAFVDNEIYMQRSGGTNTLLLLWVLITWCRYSHMMDTGEIQTMVMVRHSNIFLKQFLFSLTVLQLVFMDSWWI